MELDKVGKMQMALSTNGLQLQEVGDFYHKTSYEAHTSNIKQTFLRSTISPIYCRCC
jgi:hypothetical protein